MKTQIKKNKAILFLISTILVLSGCGSNSGSGDGTTTTSSTAYRCIGYYYYMSSYGTQMVYCNGSNCRGYTLFSYQNQSWVTCQ